MSGGPIVVAVPNIRAVFERVGDRWGHRIELTSETKPAVVVMQSIEGADGEVWPPSPVIQHLEFQSAHDGRSSAIGLGMSGSSHWSLSCTTKPVGDKTWAGPSFWFLQFEIACRVRQRFERVGSTYHVFPEVSASEQKGGVVYHCSEGEWGATSNAQRICNLNQTLHIDEFDDDSAPPVRTVHWVYIVSRIQNAGLRRQPATK